MVSRGDCYSVGSTKGCYHRFENPTTVTAERFKTMTFGQGLSSQSHGFEDKAYGFEYKAYAYLRLFGERREIHCFGSAEDSSYAERVSDNDEDELDIEKKYRMLDVEKEQEWNQVFWMLKKNENGRNAVH